MEITFIYIAQKDKMFAREEQLHNTASTTLTFGKHLHRQHATIKCC